MAQTNPVAAIGNIYKTPELWEKITFTLLVLVVLRVHNGVEWAAASLPLNARRQHIAAVVGLVRRGLVDVDSEQRPLHQIFPAHRPGCAAGLQQRNERHASALALNDARIQQHDFL